MQTDTSSQMVSQQQYYAYGKQRDSGPVGTDHQYTGQKLDGTGLMYYNARYYDPQIGQFVSPDTIVPDPANVLDYNRYMYGLGNPVSNVDPSGHSSVVFDGGANGSAAYSPVLSQEQISYVQDASEHFGIPWQVTAGLLESEILLDTDWKDYLETWAIQVFPFSAHLRSDPGPGIGNIHLSTARSTSLYFAENYTDSLAGMGDQDAFRVFLAHNLTKDEYSIWTVASITRQLADQRFGENNQPLLEAHSKLGDWTIADAVTIWHGYRYGVPDISPNGQGFANLADFQSENIMLQVDIFKGPGARESTRGSVSPYIYYFNQE